MSIQDKITDDMKAAMKSGDAPKRDTLRMVLSQLKYAQLDKSDALTEDEEMAVLTNAAKKRQEAMEMYQKADRQELFEQEKRELAVISGYLPEQMSDTEIEVAVTEAMQAVNAESIKDLGKVMGILMKSLKGRADGKKVQTIVRQKLV
ncbi:GatB/YqeY domain-containing protein [bacterium]|nr:GatB/YqeY domain-containing protein [bacterium]